MLVGVVNPAHAERGECIFAAKNVFAERKTFSFSKKRQCQAAYSLEGTAMTAITSAPSGIGMIDRKAATTSAPVIIRVALQLFGGSA